MIEALIRGWGYVGIVVGTAVEGEGVVVLGGILAHHGLLRLPLVMLSAFIGSFAADQAWFAIGRWFGGRLGTRPRLRHRIATIERLVRARGDLFVLSFRFLVGFRTLTPVVLGSGGYPSQRFAMLNAAGAAVWAVTMGAAGWMFGTTIEVLLGRAKRFEDALLRAVVVVLGALLLVHLVHALFGGPRSTDRARKA